MSNKAKPTSRPSHAGRSRREAQGEATRERLLRATEHLVGLHGVDGVSTRQIAKEAGTELGAIHHHFGTKDQLITSVLDWRVGIVDGIASDFIAERRATKDRLTIEDLAEFVVLPIIGVSEDTGSIRNYPSFLAAITNCRRLADRVAIDTPWSMTILAIYAEVKPDLDEQERRRRFALSSFLAVGTIADGGLRAWISQASGDDTKAIASSLVTCVAATLGAPKS